MEVGQARSKAADETPSSFYRESSIARGSSSRRRRRNERRNDSYVKKMDSSRARLAF